MKRKNFLKKISFLFLTPILLTETLKASTKPPSTNSSTVRITDECVNCGACIEESPSEMIIESGGEYIYNIQSGAIYSVSDGGKTATIGSGSFDEWETLRDVCPAEAIVEIG